MLSSRRRVVSGFLFSSSEALVQSLFKATHAFNASKNTDDKNRKNLREKY